MYYEKWPTLVGFFTSKQHGMSRGFSAIAEILFYIWPYVGLTDDPGFISMLMHRYRIQ